MISYLVSFPELAHMESSRRREAWQFGFGAVSARPIHLVAAVGFIVSVVVLSAVGDIALAGWSGRILGNVCGVVLGGLIYDRVMYRAMRPHVLQFLSGGK